MRRADALEQVQKVLGRVKEYVDEHDVLEDVAELNEKYVPEQLRDEVTWLTDMVGRLLDADPNDPDHDGAVEVPAVGELAR